MLGKASTFKRVRYSPLAKELKEQSDNEKKSHQKVDKTYEIDETINEDDKKLTLTNNKNQIQYMTIIKVFTNIVNIIKNLITFLLDQSILF